MSEILCVTNRQLCREDFLTRLERIAAAGPAGIILREKDLPEADYRRLAEQVLERCRRHGVPCILHSFPDAAADLGAESIAFPLVSAGVYGWPKDDAVRRALRGFAAAPASIGKISLVLFDSADVALAEDVAAAEGIELPD